jgi:hypothetical protein
MDGLTESKTKQKKQMMTTPSTSNGTVPGPSSGRLQTSYSSSSQDEDEIIAAGAATTAVIDGAASFVNSNTTPSQLDGVIDSITLGMSRKALNTRLKTEDALPHQSFKRIYDMRTHIVRAD